MTIPTASLVGDAPAVATKPALRGVLHTWAAAVVLPAAALAFSRADGGGEVLAVALYVAGMAAMFGVSACYHRGRWQPAVHARLARLDHSTIYLGIACTYTPIVALAVTGWPGRAVLVTVWAAAVAGITVQWLPLALPRWIFTALYVVTGWCAVAVLPGLWRGLGPLGFTLVLVGGLAYSAGAVVYALRRPDPRPAVFGFHEVFHTCTIVGAACHYGAVLIALGVH